MRFSFDVPRLSWLNGKTHKSCFASRKNKSGHLLEHIAAAGKVSRHTTERLDSFVDAIAGKRITYAQLTKGKTWFDAEETA